MGEALGAGVKNQQGKQCIVQGKEKGSVVHESENTKLSDIRLERDPSAFGRTEFTQDSSGTESLQPLG